MTCFGQCFEALTAHPSMREIPHPEVLRSSLEGRAS